MAGCKPHDQLRLAEPEVLEWRLAVADRGPGHPHGAGGARRWRGGDGVLRRIGFRETMTVAILSGHGAFPVRHSRSRHRPAGKLSMQSA
jgi:N-methylhydantoinase B/oxoprolinase/acetone carboxylase alpha subunit